MDVHIKEKLDYDNFVFKMDLIWKPRTSTLFTSIIRESNPKQGNDCQEENK